MNFNLTILEPELSVIIASLKKFTLKQGGGVYFVGGFVRDMIIGRDSSDIDIAVRGNALEIGKEIADSLGGQFVTLDEENKIGRIVFASNLYTVDVTSFEGTIGDDLARRDFTINAIAVNAGDFPDDVKDVELVDPFHGQDDIDRGLIRMISETSMTEDPVRLLRAVRLQTELGFTLDTDTRQDIIQRAPLLETVAGERVREELVKILEKSHGGEIFRYMDELGLLSSLFPEMMASKGVSQPAEHHWDVFEHSLMTISAFDYLMRYPVWEYAHDWIQEQVPWPDQATEYFGEKVGRSISRRALLKLAALLHDVAKPQTKAPDANGRIRFIGHPVDGAEITENIMKRLRFSVKETKYVTCVVKYHLRPTQMGDIPSGRAVYRYFRDTDDAGIGILYFSLADHLATRGPDLIRENWLQHTGIVKHIIDQHAKDLKVVKPQKLIDGHDLMNVFGLKPGPRMGEMLDAVREMQADGELTTREEALEYIRNVITRRKK